MSLYNDLTAVLTPYANKIKQNESDVGDIQDELSAINESLDELYVTDNLQDAALWENGALNVGDGSTFQSDTCIVTKDWIPVSKGSTLAILNSYRFSYTVNSEPTVGTAYRLESKTLGQMVQTVTISHSGYIRIAIAPPSDTSVDVSIRSNLETNILSSRFDAVSENIKNLDGKLEKTQSDVEVVNNRINDVIKSSINLIDTDRNTKDCYINEKTGEVLTYAGWDASDYILVKQAEYVAIFKGSNGWEYSPTIYMAFYDTNKQYTHGMSVSPKAPYMQAVSGDAYARISYGRVTNPDIMFGTREDLEGYIGTSKDRVLTGNYIEDDLNYKKLESLPVRIKNLDGKFDAVSENIENLDDEIGKTQNDVEATKSRFDAVIKSSINLIDTEQNTKDCYINEKTGEVVTYAGWDASGYIPVKQAEYVAIFKGSNGWEYSPVVYMAFYDVNKHYIHGMSVGPNAPYMQAVLGDAYARISYGRVTNPDIMFGTREDLEGYIGTSKDRVLTGNYIKDDLNYKKLESLPVRIIMPDKVVALVDEQFDIHYDNILCYGNIKTIPYKEMFGSSFTSMENMARAQVATAGEGNNGLRLYSSVPSAFAATQLPSTILKKVFVYKTIEKTSGAGITRNVLLIGDSTTAPGIYARELKALFEAETEPMNIRLLGTLGNGGAEVGAETGYHEGHGGYSCKTYCTTAYHNGYNNHFYNPTTEAFDFSYYMTYTGFTNIADVFIVMGINDVAAMEDYDEMMTYFRQMVTSIRSANSFDGQPARVFIALCIPPAEYEYSDMNNNSQRSKTRRLLLHERLIEEWGNRESEGFYIVPLNLSIDPEHDFKTEQRARSFRDQTMVTYCTDNVHPSTIAYNKMADRMRTYIKYAEI